MQLSQEIEGEYKGVLLRKLLEKSEGVFLYAYFLIDFVKKNVSLLNPEQLESSLPLGISSVYLSHFKRLEKGLCKELNIDEEQVLRFFCSLTASREPLVFVSRMLVLLAFSPTRQEFLVRTSEFTKLQIVTSSIFKIHINKKIL